MSGFHRDIKGDQNHIIHFREYATKEAREVATGLDATHLHKIALQTDDNTMWQLVNVSPVEWQALGGSERRVSGEVISFWGTINSAGRPLNLVTGEPMLEWGYCDGRTYLSPDGRQVTTPNIRDRFVMCTGENGTGKGTLGGAAFITQAISQIAAHVHSVATNWYAGGSAYNVGAKQSHDSKGSQNSRSTGNSAAMENRPPFIQLPFIMYL